VARCYKLNPEEKKQWEDINKNMSGSEKEAARRNFIDKVIERTTDESQSVPREAFSDIPESDAPFNREEAERAFAGTPREVQVRPRQQDFTDEMQSVEQVKRTRPEIAKKIWSPKNIHKYALAIEDIWNRGTEKGRKLLLKELKMPVKLYTLEYKDLPLKAQRLLALTQIKNNTLNMPITSHFIDIMYYLQYLEEKTGQPFMTIGVRVRNSSSIGESRKDFILKDIIEEPKFAKILGDEEALTRVEEEINSKLLDENGVPMGESPEGITDDELLLVSEIEAVYKYYEPIVRYLRVMNTENNMDAMREAFPDAVKSGQEDSLRLVVVMRAKGNLDELYDYLKPQTWGVIGSGYDPRYISKPSLKTKKTSLSSSRGEGRLETRKSVEYSTESTERNVIRRLASYVEQMEIQWLIKDDLKVLDDLWDETADKFTDRNQIAQDLSTWIARVQGIPITYTKADRLMLKLKNQAMTAIFFAPGLYVRNQFQAVLMHPDRSWLVKCLIDKSTPAERAQAKLYFDTFVSELGGIRRDWLGIGDKGFKIFDKWNKLAQKLTYYDYSDYLPRLHSFLASYGKASQATEQFRKDGDIDKWIKNSGIIHLRISERNYVLTHYLGNGDKTFNMSIDGLKKLTGYDMANYFVAQRIADITNFNYTLRERGILEMTPTGKTFWNLFVFPRGYAMRVAFQAEKIKQVFSKDTSWEEARSGFNDITKLIIAAQIFGSLWTSVTGKKKNPWDVLSTLTTWQPGGLFYGIASDMFNLIADISNLISPTADEDTKKRAEAEIASLTSRNAGNILPFYTQLVDVLDVIFQTKNIDQAGYKRARALLQNTFTTDKYTPDDIDKVQRNFWEGFTKIVLAAETPDPTQIEQIRTKLDDAELKLGKFQDSGSLYTLEQYKNEVKNQTKKLPPMYLTKDEGFSDLTMFALDCADDLKPYFELITDKQKDDWRKVHIQEEAELIFWGYYDRSIFNEKSTSGKEVKKLLDLWVSTYHVTKAMQPSAKWTDLTPVK